MWGGGGGRLLRTITCRRYVREVVEEGEGSRVHTQSVYLCVGRALSCTDIHLSAVPYRSLQSEGGRGCDGRLLVKKEPNLNKIFVRRK